MPSASFPVNEPDGTVDGSTLSRVFSRVRDIAVWVIGDVMLDEHVVGDVTRISPEAPVPVLHVRRTGQGLGGCANVARQVAALGAHVSLGGLVGDDDSGEVLIHACQESGIDIRAMRRLAARVTTRKLRALARNQQLLRLDWEETAPCTAEDTAWMLDRLREGRAPDAIILSDYAKGMITPALVGAVREFAATRGVRIVVDPKQRDFRFYRGASILTPNVHELAISVDRKLDPEDTASIADCAQSLARNIGAEAIVVTRSEHGMLVAPALGTHTLIPARGSTLFDPTGAGDTAAAVLATVLAAGATLVEAAIIANAAAGITVGRVGTVSVTQDEVIDAAGNDAAARKIMNRATLQGRVAQWRDAGRRIVFTNGCFDLLHMGHLSLLRQAARQGSALVVAINSDASVRRLKGADRPLILERERAAMLAALDCVDAVTIFDEDTPLETIEAARPDILVKGQDYRLEQVVGREVVESRGGKVVLVPLVAGRSTTALIDHIVDRRSKHRANPYERAR